MILLYYYLDIYLYNVLYNLVTLSCAFIELLVKQSVH